MDSQKDKGFKAILPQIVATMIVGGLHTVVALGLSYSAILIPQLEAEQDNDGAIVVTKKMASLFASLVNLVPSIGYLVGGILMDRIGRLNLLKIAAAPLLIGWVIIATAASMPMLIFGRVLTGFAVAWGTTPASAYVAEISSPHIRGSLGSILMLYSSLGVLLGYLEGSLMHWRTVAWTCVGMTLLPTMLITILPESPTWLAHKQQPEKAEKSLLWFNKYCDSQEKSKRQLFSLVEQKAEKNSANANKNKNAFKMFLDPQAYKPFLILESLFFFQKICGIFIILPYAVTFVQRTGTDINPYLVATCLGVMRFVMSVANIFLTRHCNRRTLLFCSTLGMCVCIAISGLFTSWVSKGVTTYTWVSPIMLMLYILFAMMGLIPLPFSLCAEYFSVENRGLLQNVTYAISRILSLIVTDNYYTLEAAFGGSAGLQYFFAIMSMGAFLYCYVFVPESHKKTLDELQEYFAVHNTHFSVKGGKYETVQTSVNV